MENIFKAKGMKVTIQYSTLDCKLTVFRTIYFPASSYPVFAFL